MSNSRYFAQGTDFYRVKYDREDVLCVDGPYISVSSARRQLKSQTSEGRRGWKMYNSGKIQKLVAQCSEEENSDGEFEHESWLMWVDVES